MGNPYAERFHVKRSKPVAVGNAAVKAREDQALRKRSKQTRALYRGWQRDLREASEPDAEFLDSILSLVETAGSLAASSKALELEAQTAATDDNETIADVVERRIDDAFTRAQAVREAPASTVDFELSRFVEPPPLSLDAPLLDTASRFAESFCDPRRKAASVKPSLHDIEAARELKRHRPRSTKANTILRAAQRSALTMPMLPLEHEARGAVKPSPKDTSTSKAERRKRKREADLRQAFHDRARALPESPKDGGLVDGVGTCRVNRAGNPRRVPDFARDFWKRNPATAPAAIAFGLALHTFQLVDGSGVGAGFADEALRDRAPLEDRRVVCKEELETLSSTADIEAAARRAARHAVHKMDGVVLQPRLHDGTSLQGKRIFGSSAPGIHAAEGASLLDLKAYGRERKGFQSTGRWDAHHGSTEHASVYTLQCFYRKRAERRNALAIKLARWYRFHGARYAHREMRREEIAAARKIQVFVHAVLMRIRLRIRTRKRLAKMLSRTLGFYWLKKVARRTFRKHLLNKNRWAGESIVLFVRACRRKGWLKKRQEATLGRAQRVISGKWRTRLKSREFQEMSSDTKARLLTNKMKEYGGAARFQRAWRNYAQYIYFPCVYAMQKFFRACWLLKKIRRQRLAVSVMQTFPRMVIGMKKMKDRKRAVVAHERQRVGKEEEFAQQAAKEALAEVDAQLQQRVKTVRVLLKEARREVLAQAKCMVFACGPSPWDERASQEIPVFREPLPPIHVPPNRKPSCFSRKVAPEPPSSPQPANMARMAAPPPPRPTTPPWRPNLSQNHQALRALAHDRKLASKVARRAKARLLKRMTKEERATYDAHVLKLGRIGEGSLEFHHEQQKARKREDKLISKRERERDRTLLRESRALRKAEKGRRKRAIKRVKADIRRTARNARKWPQLHADAAYAVALFARDGGLDEVRLKQAAAGLQRVRAPTSKVQPYAANPPPRMRRVRRDTLVGVEEATHWLADIAAEARPYHPRFRWERRRGFSSCITAAAKFKVRMDVREERYEEALDTYREINPPRHACRWCCMPFALLDQLRDHNADGCPHRPEFWRAEKHRLPDPNLELLSSDSSSEDEVEVEAEPSVISTLPSVTFETTEAPAPAPKTKTKAERRAQRERAKRDRFNKQQRRDRDLRTREGRSRHKMEGALGAASQDADPSWRARMTRAERQQRDEAAAALFHSKWAAPDGAKTVYKEEEVQAQLYPWAYDRPRLLPPGCRLADARVADRPAPGAARPPVRSGNKWMWG